MKNSVVNLINFYQAYLSFDRGLLALFAPGGACRNYPSCSEYTKEKIRKSGVFRGIWLGLQRVWRCR